MIYHGKHDSASGFRAGGERRIMVYRFTIAGRLPGMNEFISANRTHPVKGHRMKRDSQGLVISTAACQLGKLHIRRPVRINYRFYEPNRKRDLDNIAGFAHKVVQDALVEYGILPNDSWEYIKGFTDTFALDSQNPRIEIEIEEM